MEKRKNSTPNALISIAMMFLVIGITFDNPGWLKYTFMFISILLSIISLVLSLKEKKEEKG